MGRMRTHAPPDSLSRAKHIGIACQMHGVVMWNKAANSDALAAPLSVAHADVLDSVFSPLVTWEDQRCDATFLHHLNLHAEPTADPAAPSLSGQRVSSGFGSASLAHLARQSASDRNSTFSRYDHAGSIGDLLAFLLTAQRVHAMDHTNAAAWGMYCMRRGQWQMDRCVIISTGGNKRSATATVQ